MIRYKMFEREITAGEHRSYHVCVNNFGSNFSSKSKFYPIDEALSKINEDFTDYECNITLANHTSPNDYFHISYLAKNLYPPYIQENVLDAFNIKVNFPVIYFTRQYPYVDNFKVGFDYNTYQKFNSKFSSNLNFSNSLIEEGKKDVIDLFSKINGIKKINMEFDFSLARGLDYYTGMIFEIKCNKVPIGSIGGGGRYDNLTTLFGNNVGSGVGISFGVERIMICLDELNLFPNGLDCFIDVLFVNLGDEESSLSQVYIDKLRSYGIKCELFPDNLKLKKQMSYANNSGAKYTALVGEEEMKTKKITLKNMSNGTQESLSFKDLINKLK